MPKNYYFILGISQNAPLAEVKSAYRRLVKEYHPDYYGDEASPFLTLQEAYSVLSDPSRRRAYDRSLDDSRGRRTVTNVEPTRTREKPPIEPLFPTQGRTDLGTLSLMRSFSSYRPSWDALFDRILGNFLPESRPKGETVESLTAEVLLTQQEALQGGSVRLLVPARLRCPVCNGRGGVGPYECWQCSGVGVEVGQFPLVINFPGHMPDNYSVDVPLDSYGIRNLHLIVDFRVTQRL